MVIFINYTFQQPIDNSYKKGDFANAIKDWILLGEDGDEKAQYFLGLIYYKGKGVPQDHKTAIKWYTLSAEQGYAEAQFNLGLMYVLGEGVIEDMVYAHMWFNISASSGSEKGKGLKDLLTEEMTPSQIEKAQRLARECVKKN